MNESVLDRVLTAFNRTHELVALAGCCNGSALTTDHGGSADLPAEERAQLVTRLVQIAVLCVLSLTVLFGVFFLGCNLMMRSESLVDFLETERRPSKEAGGVAVGLG
ncbi:reprimo-like protein [Scleropages formosus]|nr:reprimo-like protein [Scleropages formosus]